MPTVATGDETFVAGTQYTCSFERLLFLPSELTAGVEYNYKAALDRQVSRIRPRFAGRRPAVRGSSSRTSGAASGSTFSSAVVWTSTT